jgi:ParB family chromosome partitioning protein
MKIENAKVKLVEAKKSESFQPKRLSAFSDSNRSEIVYIDTDRLIPYIKQARRFFDEEEIDNLAQTIKEHGLRQPLTVIRESENSSFFEVISGERRLRACKKNELLKVPCIILKNIDQAEEVALVENIQRQDLHPLELAYSLKSLIDKRQWDQVSVSKNLGMGASKISELLKLLKLDESIQSSILENNIRGRDELRYISSLKSMDSQKKYIHSKFGDNKQEEKEVEIKKESILRVFVNGNNVSLQSKKIKELSADQKRSVLFELEKIIKILQE